MAGVRILYFFGVFFLIVSVNGIFIMVKDGTIYTEGYVMLFYFIVTFVFFIIGRKKHKRIKKERALKAEAALLVKQQHEAYLAQISENARKRNAASQTASPSTAPLAKMIECAGCGARQSVLPDQSTECEYCSSSIVYR